MYCFSFPYFPRLKGTRTLTFFLVRIFCLVQLILRNNDFVVYTKIRRMSISLKIIKRRPAIFLKYRG